MKGGGLILWNATFYLRNVQDLLAYVKTPHDRRFGELVADARSPRSVLLHTTRSVASWCWSSRRVKPVCQNFEPRFLKVVPAKFVLHLTWEQRWPDCSRWSSQHAHDTRFRSPSSGQVVLMICGTLDCRLWLCRQVDSIIVTRSSELARDVYSCTA